MSTQARYKMVLNPRETARYIADVEYRDDRKTCALLYATQVEAPVDLFLADDTSVFSTDAAPDPVPVDVAPNRKAKP